MIRHGKRLWIGMLVLVIGCWAAAAYAHAADLPEGFVYLKDVAPDIVVDLRYYSGENFIGERIDGYLAPRCILSMQAAVALSKVQGDLRRFGLGLKVFDAYRPQSAVDHFVRWAQDLDDTRMKSRYYPDVDKAGLFEQGYIASRSSHTRGSAVDLTLIALDGEDGARELDMGSGFDFFGRASWPDHSAMSPEQRAHRLLLRMAMMRHGFEPYAKEWWHFMLKPEPFPDIYFDFPVQ